jgi:4-amino-4-deoxy-L-arabinose transferase-like glycosyltransferase
MGGAIDMRSARDAVPAVVFWSVAVFLSLGWLGARELWGPEDRWAEVVREMRQTGDYFHPRINGEPYFDKPLLSYWLIALAASVTGRLDEWTVRLPSVVAGLVTLWATMNLGRRIASHRQARTAGWILLSAYGFLFWARTGEADMENMAAIILAVGWYWARRDRPTFTSYAVFYAICFLGAQAKGMAAIAVPLLVVLPDLARENRWRAHVSVSHVLALAMGLLLYLAPLDWADVTRGGYRASGLGMAFHENVVRYFHPFDHKEPFYAYFLYLPELFFPWTPLLIAAIWAAYTFRRQLDWPTKWLAISTILIFLFFTLSGSRRSYYILTILPFCALLASLYLRIESAERPRFWTTRIQTSLLVAALAAEIALPVAWPVIKHWMGSDAPSRLVWGTVLLGLVGLTPLAIERIRPGLMTRIAGSETVLSPLIVTSVILVGGYVTWQDQVLDGYHTMRSFCRELQSELADPDVKMAYFRDFPFEVLFYLDWPQQIRPVQNTEGLNDFLNSQGETRVLICRGEFRQELAGLLPAGTTIQPTLKERVYPWQDESKKYTAWISRRVAK